MEEPHELSGGFKGKMIKWVLDKDSDKMWDEMTSYIK